MEGLHGWFVGAACGGGGSGSSGGFGAFLLRFDAQVETQVHNGVESGRDVCAALAGDIALELPVEGAVDDTFTGVVVAAVCDVELVEEELEVLVGVLLLVSGEGLAAFPGCGEEVDGAEAVSFVGCEELGEDFVHGAGHAVCCCAFFRFVSVGEVEVAYEGVVDEGLEDDGHEAGGPHVEEAT